MKKATHVLTLGVLTLGLIVGVVGVPNAWSGKIGTWAHQGQRIHQGVYSGELTRAETRVLLNQQHRIAHVKQRAWADGHLTTCERRQLRKLQIKADRHIFGFKHNHRRLR